MKCLFSAFKSTLHHIGATNLGLQSLSLVNWLDQEKISNIRQKLYEKANCSLNKKKALTLANPAIANSLTK